MSDLAVKTGAYLSQLLKVEDAQIVSSASAGDCLICRGFDWSRRPVPILSSLHGKITRREIVVPKGHNVDYGTPVEVMVAQGVDKSSKRDMQICVHRSMSLG